MKSPIIKYFSNSDLLNVDVNVFFENIIEKNNILDVQIINITTNSAEIIFKTTNSSASKIKFKTGCPKDLNGNNICETSFTENLAIEHKIRLLNLSEGETSNFNIIVKDKSGEEITSIEYKLTTLIAPKKEEISEVEIVTTPKIINEIQPKYILNLEQSRTFVLDLEVNNNTEKVRYYLGKLNSTPKEIIVNNNKAQLTIQNLQNLGLYELVIIPFNSITGDGDEIKTLLEIVQEISYGKPDITEIVYDSNIVEADLKPLDFYFKFEIKTINSQYINVYLGDNLLDTIQTENNKIIYSNFYAKNLYASYSELFNETEDSYILTFYFQPYFNGVKEKIFGEKEAVTINVKKTKFSLNKDEVVDVFFSAFNYLFSGPNTKKDFEDKIIFEDDKHLYYRIKTDSPSYDSFVITNIAEDDITYSIENEKVVPTQFIVDSETGNTKRKSTQKPYGALVLKLLEPLPATVEENLQVWISKQIIPTIVETILIRDEEDEQCPPLKPNFSVDVLDEMGYEFYDEIISSGSVKSADIVNKFINNNKFSLEELNIEYFSGSNTVSDSFLKFENFVNFSSAVTRIENFEYKLSSIKFWEDKIITSLSSASILSTSSYSLITSQSYAEKVTNIKNGFDDFEKQLYSNFNVTNTNNAFFDVQKTKASVYDKNNINYLVNHLPVYLKEDNANLEFLTFMEMIGQHFDVIWSYINGITKIKKINHLSTKGISDKLVYTLLENLGWDPKFPFSGQQLWKEAFGVNSDGSVTPNSNLLGNNVVSNYTFSQARNELWRRILNNLPYLLKHKGTKKAINAIMSCYGVPSSLLTIVEFGGPGNDTSQLNNYTYEDRTAALNLNNGEYISTPWILSYNPNSISLRFKTSNKNETNLLKIESGSSYLRVYAKPSYTGSYGNVWIESNSTKNIYDGITTSIVQNTVISSSLSENIPLFDGYFKNITVQKSQTVNTSSGVFNNFTLFVKEAVDDRIIMSETASLNFQISSSYSTYSGSVFYTDVAFNNDGVALISSGNLGIVGYVDEFRIWNTQISESILDAHTLNPDIIYGNGVYSSTENLLFRLDFEYPKDRIIDPYIKNVSPERAYAYFATASINTSAPSYPYQYDVYERFVTAKIPSIGFVGRDKVRLETQYNSKGDVIDSNNGVELTYRNRVTKKSLDRAPIDSNKLGLFFSPVKELNLDILKSLGPINIGDFIGDWKDEYNTNSYKDLDNLRAYYFKRTNLNFEEYIKLVKSIDKSLFEMLMQVVPARANVVRGLLIEPSLLERNKTKINRPVAENIYYTSSVNAKLNENLSAEKKDYQFYLDLKNQVNFLNEFKNLETTISNENIDVVAETLNIKGTIQQNEITNLSGDITYNSGSTMGGIEIIVNARLDEPTILGEYDLEESYQSVGNDPDSPFNKGFGLFGEGGTVDRTYFREDGSLVLTDRKNAYILKIRYARDIPNTNISGITNFETVYKYEKKLILVDALDLNVLPNPAYRSPLQHSFYTNINSNLGTFPYGKGVVVEIYPFDGYTTGHYRNVKDNSKGLENSYFNGSKQTSKTTIDNTSPVEVFATNPNRLKVSDAGRGSGEPILEVD